MKNPITPIITILILSLTITGCNQALPPSSPQEIDQAINLAGEWFLNNQNDNFLYYEYYLDTNSYSTNDHPLRELASLWSIARLANFTNDSRYQELANKGLDYFEHYIYHDEDHDFSYLKYGESKITIGDSAFMILSLIESKRPDRDDIITSLADGIIFQQNEDGYLPVYFYSDIVHNQDFLPGEALLALMATFEHNQDPKYLEATLKSFSYYRQYWREQPSTALVPWHSRAYYKLYQASPNPEIADFIFEMNNYVLQEFNPNEPCQNFKFSSGGTIAVNLEGIVQALSLAQQLGDQAHQTCYQNFIDESIPYIISFQAQPDQNLPPTAIGGIWDIEKNSQRVDRNQHFVMALIDHQTILNTANNQ